MYIELEKEFRPKTKQTANRLEICFEVMRYGTVPVLYLVPIRLKFILYFFFLGEKILEMRDMKSRRRKERENNFHSLKSTVIGNSFYCRK